MAEGDCGNRHESTTLSVSGSIMPNITGRINVHQPKPKKGHKAKDANSPNVQPVQNAHNENSGLRSGNILRLSLYNATYTGDAA